ncbi:3-oxoacyl-ACP reductase [Herbaspirillum sp. BH-1]|jgi:NAD(P)-dependent dehydrogenase (short-subunit alcohol dehydrogenase family)|uniref:NAD(P)-dependent dehydrogenase (Short-subunit alcohol dehydrogenase family) n=1 Tax=Herbaspirillum frisingense TaxID=92645 RepID=A0ABU1PFS6_9BURK|nr:MULTISPECIES: glucose 1-dehydrogenase [Herbaspirillum]MDR6584188.1 NAD(P)-dependent dehydrogenase (short-subunit alcohol dehydrogenase family) [Herbaspirillum frisingense]PLY57009.1 3-oxoacyl-ACP reductase [Herbaspirillum sp. BH-1]
MAKRFDDKVVVVTGGSEGIGLATAKLFAAEGARVYVTGRRADKLDAAVREIGHGAVGVSGDAANPGDLDRLYARIQAEQGRVDVLFANAGTASADAKPLGLIDEADFDQIFNLNVRGLLFSVQKALPLMSAGGAIVLNGSVAGVKGFPGQSLYNASKAAVRSFARSWTADLKDRQIRVNVVAPGGTETRLMRDYLEARPGVEDALRQLIPAGRLGEPDEVGRAVLFLASPESSYIAGVELFVDGGSVAV